MRNSLRVLVLVLAITVLSGCAQAEPPLDSNPDASETAPAPNQPQDPGTKPAACREDVQVEIEDAINSQTSAFAASDYELAYSFASPGFRSSVSLAAFVQIIASSYGPLIESSQLSFSNCLVNAETGFALIDVSFLEAGNSVYGLRYLMTQTADGWRVEGAGDLEVVGEGT